MAPQRLSKVLAACGIASRRKCEDIIREGVVTVNGSVVIVPETHVELSKDKITVRGKPVKQKERHVYFMLNKPAGYLCTSIEAASDRSVLTLFEGEKERLFTVGRLDLMTSGLLLVTNDGHFANNVIHPSKNITKEYVAKVNEEVTDEHLKGISKGCDIEGVHIRPASVKKVRKGTIKVAVSEGKKREVRLLIENVGLEVKELKRTRIGSLLLGDLPVGSYRPLKESEIQSLCAED